MPLRSEMVERLARVLARTYAHDEEKWRGYVSTAQAAAAEMLPLAEVTIATSEAELTRYEAARLYEWAIGDGTREAPTDRHALAAVRRGLRFLVALAGDHLKWTPTDVDGLIEAVDVVSAGAARGREVGLMRACEHWPLRVLPVKRERICKGQNVGFSRPDLVSGSWFESWFETGSLVRGEDFAGLPEVWVDGVPQSYDSFEAIYDDGWRVD